MVGVGWRRWAWGVALGIYICIWQVESLSLCFLIILGAASLCHTLLPPCSASPWAPRDGVFCVWIETSETVNPKITLVTIVLVRSLSHSSKKSWLKHPFSLSRLLDSSCCYMIYHTSCGNSVHAQFTDSWERGDLNRVFFPFSLCIQFTKIIEYLS